MKIEQSNIIPNIHQLITDELGENHHFNGCARYVMECLNELDYDYWFFAGLTGDNMVQLYSYDEYMGECLSDCLTADNDSDFLTGVFKKVGYSSSFVKKELLTTETEKYLQILKTYIDRGIPVITVNYGGGIPWGVYVGYENSGKTLLLITDENNPKHIPVEIAAQDKGWLFIEEKTKDVDLAQLYSDAIKQLPTLFNIQNHKYCFGANAFRAWADGIESGKFDGLKPEEFDGWTAHISMICNMATNSGGCQSFLRKAQELNPNLTFLADVRRQYMFTCYLWNGGHWRDVFSQEERDAAAIILNCENLESINGAFDITLETLQDKEKRTKIVKLIRKAADCIDEVARLIKNNTKGK